MSLAVYDNDKTIFKFLNPDSNDKLSDLSKSQLDDLLMYLDKYYLEYRDYIGLAETDTFGIEIEMENFKGYLKEFYQFQQEIDKIVGNNKWEVKNDITLHFGREVSSEILTDSQINWEHIKGVCGLSRENAEIDVNCGGHIHCGAHILGGNVLYWYRFFKIWSIYENVIYRFGYGEYLTHRPNIVSHAQPCASFYNETLKLIEDKLDWEMCRALWCLKGGYSVDSGFLKKMGLSFWHMLCDENYDVYEDYNKMTKYCTVEARAFNGTLNEIIWQNNINFIIKLMLYCKSDKFDDDILNRRKTKVEDLFSDIWAYSEIYNEQAVELCDLIFDNNLDKLYFLRQYFKSFDVSHEPFVREKGFTVLTKRQ